MRLLATIAARGGSKGVPGKNIRDLLGKPLIAYSVEQMKAWGKYDKFIVSTDFREIAEIARHYGAEVPFLRPAELATDTIGKILVLRHALIEAEKYYSRKFEALLDLDATAPIRTAKDIDNLVNLFIEKKPNCVFSVVKARKNPYFNMVEESEGGAIKISKSRAAPILARQAAPVVYEVNASMYIFNREFLLDVNTKTPISDKSLIYEMDPVCSVDIDSELDFKFVEFLLKEGVIRL